MNITPQLGEHFILTGKTGSGKTTTATALLGAISRSYPVLILDSKGERKFEALPGSIVVSLPSKLRYEGVEIYRPEGVLSTPGYMDALLYRVYELRRSMYLFVDEVGSLTRSTNPGPGLHNILQRGRERWVGGRRVQVSLGMGSQRPARIPFQCFSESTHFFSHRLQTLKDRKTMAEHLGDVLVQRPLAGHEFWYYTHSMAQPRRMVIDLSAGAGRPVALKE